MDYRKMKIEYVRFIPGTEAYKLDVDQPVRRATQPVKKKTHKAAKRSVKTIELSIDPLALIAICMTVVMVVLMCVGFSNLRDAQADLEQMEQYVEILQTNLDKENATFNERLNLESLEKAALSLGMVPIDEVDHLFVAMDAPAD